MSASRTSDLMPLDTVLPGGRMLEDLRQYLHGYREATHGMCDHSMPDHYPPERYGYERDCRYLAERIAEFLTEKVES